MLRILRSSSRNIIFDITARAPMLIILIATGMYSECFADEGCIPAISYLGSSLPREVLMKLRGFRVIYHLPRKWKKEKSALINPRRSENNSFCWCKDFRRSRGTLGKTTFIADSFNALPSLSWGIFLSS